MSQKTVDRGRLGHTEAQSPRQELQCRFGHPHAADCRTSILQHESYRPDQLPYYLRLCQTLYILMTAGLPLAVRSASMTHMNTQPG